MINNRHLNTYFHTDSDSFASVNTDLEDNNTILDNCHDNNMDINFFNNIIEHPFVDTISSDYGEILKCNVNKTFNILVYRINNTHDLPYIEFYLDNFQSFQSITLGYIDNINEMNSEINKQLQNKGMKKAQGIIKYNEEDYLIIQNRYYNNNNNNNNSNIYQYSNWLTIYDIIKNKHYFGEYINQYIINFFIANFHLSDLFINDKLVMSPTILYTHVDIKYLNSVSNHNSIMFCQPDIIDSYVKLRTYRNEDNIRTICFIDDIVYSDNINALEYCSFIMMKTYNNNNCNIPEWIFRNENKIIYCKK